MADVTGEGDQDWREGGLSRAYSIFQMAEVAVSRELFVAILRRIRKAQAARGTNRVADAR